MEHNRIWDEIDPYGEENWGVEEDPNDVIFIFDSVPVWYSYSGASGTSGFVSNSTRGIEVKSKIIRNRLPKERKVKIKFYNNNKFNLFKVRKYCK